MIPQCFSSLSGVVSALPRSQRWWHNHRLGLDKRRDSFVPSRWNLCSIRSVMLFFLVWRRERGSSAPLDRDLGKREPLILKIPAL
jgi:hypothetical protein